MKTEIVEHVVMRMFHYPQSHKLVAHVYDAAGCLIHRAAMDAHEAGSFRATVARLLAALGAKVESDPTL